MHLHGSSLGLARHDLIRMGEGDGRPRRCGTNSEPAQRHDPVLPVNDGELRPARGGGCVEADSSDGLPAEAISPASTNMSRFASGRLLFPDYRRWRVASAV